MRFLLTDDRRTILATIDVSADDCETIAIERADRPDLLYFGADLHCDGRVHVGHWPAGEEWDGLLDTRGVPVEPDCHTPAPARPGPVTYTREDVAQAIETARERVRALGGGAEHLDLFAAAVMELLEGAGHTPPR